MKLLLLGATGASGQQVLAQAISAGHQLTVMVRDPARLGVASQRLHVVRGSLPDDAEALATAIQGQDAIISTLGVGLSFKSRGLISGAAPAILGAMARAGVRRLVFTSAFGVGVTRRDVPWLPRLFMATLLRDVYADKEAGEKSILASPLDWTLVYPAGLTNGSLIGRYRSGEHLPLHGFPKLSRADLAQFLLSQLTDRSYLRKQVLVAY